MSLSKYKKRIASLMIASAIAAVGLLGCSNETTDGRPETAAPTQQAQAETVPPSDAETTPAAITFVPTDVPSEAPTEAPTEQPTDEPTQEPTKAPATEAPKGQEPTEAPQTTPDSDGFYPIDWKTGTINAPYVNLRAKPSTDAVIYTELTQGTEVNVTGENADWYRVRHQGVRGYIAKPYLSVDGHAQQPSNTQSPAATNTPAPSVTTAPTTAPTAAPTATPKPTSAPDSFEPVDNLAGHINTAYVNFRSEPSTDSEIIRILTYGTEVTVIAKNSEWYRARYAGTVGYIAKPYLTLGSQSTQTPKPTHTPKPTQTPKPTAAPEQDPIEDISNQTAYVNTQRVNFRTEPNTDSQVIAVLTYGTEVRVTGRNSKWYRAVHNGRTGYISKKYLTLGNAPAPTPTPTPAPNPGGHQFTDYEIRLVAALCHMEGPGSTYVGYRAIASVVYNRVLNQSGHFPNTVVGVLLQRNQFGNRPLSMFENTTPNSVAQAAAEYVFRTHGSTLPPKVLFYRAVWCGIPWYDFTEYYATIEANNYYYGILYYDILPGELPPMMLER